jgi:putative restriction endonuclease
MLRRQWSHDELLIAFNLYCKTPFGRLHRHNPEIIQLANRLGRTPSAVAMKLVNFASLDPAHQRRNIAGLKNASQGDREIFAEFSADWERLAFESEQAADRLRAAEKQVGQLADEATLTGMPTEREQLVRVRLVQRFFRAAVLASYGYECAVCRIAIPELLNASHIIPWSADAARRADPTNGLAMCALHDRAFDRGLLAVNDDLRILVSRRAIVADPPEVHRVALVQASGQALTMPERFQPDRSALRFHRQNVFSD